VEAVRLQGLPEWFTFGEQRDAASYKQLRNGVSVGAAYFVFRQSLLASISDVAAVNPTLAEAVKHSSEKPILTSHGKR